ncbi:UDP-glucose 6-dehydrogenase [Helicobacter sp. 12S02634-8]|uniref:nucleotide sugar dehydrogenase n=1 Tax=Helicobacter sp. 12S02634-8 TaxID=1476199 RepID=UPI000BA67C26|nr:nucleotide sugar dehydrogenase [Helicobacter sp. 12S02634-8]PAF47038.1 UDP-glucose 6-dehydrogenase [Helicobacter sp. 12S02634-8]
MQVAVFGLGFVGLTTAIGFAKQGFQVRGCEIDTHKCAMLQKGKIPFHEAHLDTALQEVLGKTLTITHNTTQALQNARVIFYCIGTPMGKDGEANLDFILQALRDFAHNKNICAPKPILVIKSTIPPSSSTEVFIPFLQSLGLQNNQDLILANNPEFLREGSAYEDFMHPDRIVIGSQNAQIIPALQELYAPFGAEIIHTNLNTAEFIKYLSNTTLSMLISYANEMSMIAQSIGGIDIIQAFKTLHTDKRFSGTPAHITSYLYPGMGFGGYCLPKDTLALLKKSQDKGYQAKILPNILAINDQILDFHLNRFQKEVPKDTKIGVLGLSFKPNSDDIRDTKSATLIQGLLQRGFLHIGAFDPMATQAFQSTYALDIDYFEDLNALYAWAEVFIIATAWDIFTNTIPPHKKIYNLRYMPITPKE